MQTAGVAAGDKAAGQAEKNCREKKNAAAGRCGGCRRFVLYEIAADGRLLPARKTDPGAPAEPRCPVFPVQPGRTGRVRMNAVPCSAVDSARSVHLLVWAIARAMDRPSPYPPSAERAGSAR